MTAESKNEGPRPVDLPRLAARARGRRIAWTANSQDLNVNLIVLGRDEDIDTHRNDEVDVLIVGVGGTGEITIDRDVYRITPDTAIIVPRGSTRSVRALAAPFAYLTCHRQRRQLWPSTQGERDRGGESDSG